MQAAPAERTQLSGHRSDAEYAFAGASYFLSLSELKPSSNQRNAQPARTRNRGRVFSLLERVGSAGLGDVRFAAIECRGVQCFSLHGSARTSTEIEFNFKILFRILVQDDHR